MIRLESVAASVREPGGEREILRGVDLAVAPGECHRILGANGSGKSTLVRILAGLRSPTRGRVHRDEGSFPSLGPSPAPFSTRTLWPRLAVLFEEPDPQFLTDSVEAEVAFGLESLALPHDEIRARTARAIEAFGLAGLERRAPHALSGGEKARALLAAANAPRPGALLLDQALAHLDAGTRLDLESGLARAVAEGTLGVVRTVQEPDAPWKGERLHVLVDGRLVDAAALRPEEILALDDVPWPLALRVSALLALRGLWKGALALDPAGLAEGRSRPRYAGEDPARVSARSAVPRPAAGDVLLALARASWSPPERPRAAPLLRDVDLEVRSGEVVGIVGASGSGKTTLLKIAAGLLEPTAGAVRRPARAGSPGVALAMEYPERQLFGRTVAEDVEMGLWIRGVPGPDRRERARRAMETMGLEPDRFDDRAPPTLSEGEKRRASLASLIVDPPRVLLLDEPTAGLDPQGRRALARAVRRLGTEGRAVLLASHDLDFVSAVADRVLALTPQGTVAGTGCPPELWRDAALLRRAGLPAPDLIAIEDTLRSIGMGRWDGARDGDSLLEALERGLPQGTEAGPEASLIS